MIPCLEKRKYSRRGKILFNCKPGNFARRTVPQNKREVRPSGARKKIAHSSDSCCPHAGLNEWGKRTNSRHCSALSPPPKIPFIFVSLLRHPSRSDPFCRRVRTQWFCRRRPHSFLQHDQKKVHHFHFPRIRGGKKGWWDFSRIGHRLSFSRRKWRGKVWYTIACYVVRTTVGGVAS